MSSNNTLYGFQDVPSWIIGEQNMKIYNNILYIILHVTDSTCLLARNVWWGALDTCSSNREHKHNWLWIEPVGVLLLIIWDQMSHYTYGGLALHKVSVKVAKL